MKNSKRSSRIRTAVALLAVAGAIALGWTAALGTAPPERSALSEVPGFGATDETGARDDAIALWEAYQRQELIQACMNKAGFEYALEVAFPAVAVDSTASYLEFDTSRANVPEAALAGTDRAQNWSRFMALPEGDRNGYALALYGETATDLIRFDHTGEASGDDDGFATGGCVGEAGQAIPGIWSTRRKHFVELEERRAEAFDAAVANGEYRKCVESHNFEAASPGDLEALIGYGSADVSEAHDALAACHSVWDDSIIAARNDAEERFLAANEDTLLSVVDRYAGAVNEMKSHSGFVDYVSSVVHYLRADPDFPPTGE